MNEYQFSLIKSPESERDLYFNQMIMSAPTLPSRVDLSRYVTKVYDQGKAGLCHSYAGAALKNMQETIEGGRKYVMSPIALAKKVKEIDGLNQEGATLLSVCKALYSYGSIEEIDYPYGYTPGTLTFHDVDDEDNVPKYKIDANYVRCANLGDIKQALYLKKGVLIGVLCFSNVYDLNKGTDIWPMPGGNSIGGHAMFAIGYDDDMTANGHTGHLMVLNSWGDKCGDSGIIWIPYDFLNMVSKDLGMKYLMDAYTIVDVANDPIREDVITMTINDKVINVNGKEVELDQAPVIMKETSRLMMPIRWVESLGYNVTWDDSTKTATLVKRTKA